MISERVRLLEVPLAEKLPYPNESMRQARIVGKRFVRYPEHGPGYDIEIVSLIGNDREVPRGVIAHMVKKDDGYWFIYIADPKYTYGPPGTTFIGKRRSDALFCFARFLEGW